MADEGGLAQLARAPALHAGGHRFDSDILHHRSTKPMAKGSIALRSLWRRGALLYEANGEGEKR